VSHGASASFDLAVISNAAGAPSFAHFAKRWEAVVFNFWSFRLLIPSSEGKPEGWVIPGILIDKSVC
jgi:hypothetical protein